MIIRLCPMLRAAAVFATILVDHPTAHAVDVYIVAGQSNGWRISSLAEGAEAEAAEHKVYYFGMDCVAEPEKSKLQVLESLSPKKMGYSLAASLRELSGDDIVFVQYCRCGAGVWNKTDKGWYPGDNPQDGKTHDAGLYGKFLKYIAHARRTVEKEHDLAWNVKGLFWHQGESDSRTAPDDYEQNLKNLLWRFRHDLGKDLPMVAAHIRELDDGDRKINATLDRLAKQDPRMAVVPSNDLKFAPDRDGKPDVHFALEGCLELGRRMAKAHAGLIEPE